MIEMSSKVLVGRYSVIRSFFVQIMRVLFYQSAPVSQEMAIDFSFTLKFINGRLVFG